MGISLWKTGKHARARGFHTLATVRAPVRGAFRACDARIRRSDIEAVAQQARIGSLLLGILGVALHNDSLIWNSTRSKASRNHATGCGRGANHIELEAGRRIWLVSPAYAYALVGAVPDGSLAGGSVAKARRAVGHIDDLRRCVTELPRYFGAVAGEYAEVIRDHLPEIIAITAGFIMAESRSALLAATPTGARQPEIGREETK